MTRVTLELTADADCQRCKAGGLVLTTHYSGEVRYGGPPPPSYTTLGLCSCVRSEYLRQKEAERDGKP